MDGPDTLFQNFYDLSYQTSGKVKITNNSHCWVDLSFLLVRSLSLEWYQDLDGFDGTLEMVLTEYWNPFSEEERVGVSKVDSSFFNIL